MGRMLLAGIAFTVLSLTNATLVCNRDTGGKCNFFSCSWWRNADCVDGKCVCKGSCAYGGKCMSPVGCSTATPGSCSVFNCKKKRGVVDCVHGKCICKPGACEYNGVCYDKCPKDTGGSCKLLSCSDKRRAHCNGFSGGYKCMCGPGDCAAPDGMCFPGAAAAALWATVRSNMSATAVAEETFLDQLPDADDPALVAFAGLAAMAAVLIAAMKMRQRERTIQVPADSLG